ncbi:ABC-type transporter Mla MlaB component [Streptomyces avidinii]|uniref:STAS domain-containing protein n=1 Tax=[Kitasatospora] papulosa TaxID=1464011 RepID=UPI000BC5AE88|nr:STAS domain-containing protein [[Kitasatospora] papulosa]RAS30435.1 ABC-type transporter Mla MlaB component [Streptomyces avidinii]WSI17864.1 STAS domain-containing protein [[Kitasatospora] papulosa]SNX78158.1 ABC-type transporter Mla maintaining outer membrane lipid asymmetry, MlaB component, contains STAS domain [Streptomyces microflavus]
MSSGPLTGLPGVDAITPNALVVTGRVTRARVPGLCAELEALLAGAPGLAAIDCDVGGVTHSDLALVEAIARLGLVARRAGDVELRLRDVPPELRALLDLVGLSGVVGNVRAVPE